jgi:hypothetical protein
MKKRCIGRFAPIERELNAARSALQAMSETDDFDHYDLSWRNFLGHVKRVLGCMRKINIAAADVLM